MAKANKYIIRKYGKYYISGSDNYGGINKSCIFTENDVEGKCLFLDRDDELLKVGADGALTEIRYGRRKPI